MDVSLAALRMDSTKLYARGAFCRRRCWLDGVLSKLKCPVFLAHDMSGFIVNQQQSGLGESGNPAHFAGFPSGVGKSGL